MISIKLQSWFIEITLGHGCSPVNLLHIFRTPILRNTSGGLLLKSTNRRSSGSFRSYVLHLPFNILLVVVFCTMNINFMKFILLKVFHQKLRSSLIRLTSCDFQWIGAWNKYIFHNSYVYFCSSSTSIFWFGLCTVTSIVYLMRLLRIIGYQKCYLFIIIKHAFFSQIFTKAF